MTLTRSRPLARGKGLKRTGGPKRKRSSGQQSMFRRQVLKSAGGRCARCLMRFPDDRLDAHHLLPRARGGTNAVSNGAALCRGEYGCHMRVHRHEVDDWRRWLKTGRKA